MLSALSIIFINGAHKDEKELEELREALSGRKKEDRD